VSSLHIGSKLHSCLVRGCALSVLIVLLFASASAQQPKTNPLAPKTESKSQAASPGPEQNGKPARDLTPSDLEAFLDGVVPLQIAREDIAGVVITVVKDGKPFFAKGYGYSDVEKRIPVSPNTTLFRPGSISKLFNWTGIMQQVELGKLDLDRDVNDYLDFKIPPTFPKPITLRDIMTHTPGFEETVQELFVPAAANLTPLDQYLKAHLPVRIYPPFTTPAYSNYATALAGYILQRVSGEPFDTYVEHHIFQPLEMSHSTTRQPLPEALQPLMSNGYDVASGPAKPFEFVEAVPAGSSSVTGADMQHFMIAHLQDGRYNGSQILRPETAKMMHTRQFSNLPDMSGMCLGFYEETRNGHRIIGHAGDTQYFHSDLHLILDAGIGFFISYNSAGKGETRTRETVWHALLDRYFPYDPPAATAQPTAAADARLVSGRYLISRRSETTIRKVSNVIGETKVESDSGGRITVDSIKDPSGQPKKLEEIGPLMFRAVHDQDLIGFKRRSERSIGTGHRLSGFCVSTIAVEPRWCVERAFDPLRYSSVASHPCALACWGANSQTLRQGIQSHASTTPASAHRAAGLFIRSSISVLSGSVLFYGRKRHWRAQSSIQSLVENHSSHRLAGSSGNSGGGV
jgi:CubicO group peptidase (beta-lactamase class C family)